MMLAAIGTITASADQVWHAVISESEKVAIEQIEYIVSRPDVRSLDIVLNDGNTVYAGVPSLQFEFSERAGLTSITTDSEIILGPYDDVITVKGLSQGSPIMIYNSVGVVVDSYTSGGKQEALDIDLSGYTPGVYVLKTRNSAVKFVKR